MIRRLLIMAALWSLAAPSGAESFESWSAKAQKALKLRQDGSAIECLTRALQLWREGDSRAAKAKALAQRAELYEKKGLNDDALADIDSAVHLAPKRAGYYQRKGHLEIILGNPKAAVADLYRATALDLNLKEAYLDRGLAYARLGDRKFAKEDYRTACRLGLKAGCSRAQALPQSSSAGNSSADRGIGFQAVTENRKRSVEIQRGAARPTTSNEKLDLRRCRAALNACVEGGLGFGECVGKMRSCDKSPASGCCPGRCLDAFEYLAERSSEASAFREVFTDGRCTVESPLSAE